MGTLIQPQSFAMGLVDANGRPLVRVKMVRNPMLDYPRNWKCWCGKEPARAAKKCCLPHMAAAVPEKDAEIGRGYMEYVRAQFGKRDSVEAEG